MTDDTMDALVRIFADKERERLEAVHLTFGSLSPREQRLVREAAVMGYVQGVRSQPGSFGAEIPKDSEIVRRVLAACLFSGVDDLYPQINRVYERALRRAPEDRELAAPAPGAADDPTGAGERP